MVGSGFGSRRYATWQVAERAYGPVFNRSGPQGSGQVPRGSGVWGFVGLTVSNLVCLTIRKVPPRQSLAGAALPKAEALVQFA